MQSGGEEEEDVVVGGAKTIFAISSAMDFNLWNYNSSQIGSLYLIIQLNCTCSPVQYCCPASQATGDHHHQERRIVIYPNLWDVYNVCSLSLSPGPPRPVLLIPTLPFSCRGSGTKSTDNGTQCPVWFLVARFPGRRFHNELNGAVKNV